MEQESETTVKYPELKQQTNILQLIQDHPERQKDYLEYVLDIHQTEVNDDAFEKGCYYCRDTISGSRSAFLEHLYTKHFLALGKIENLVFIDELLNLVEEKIKSLVCLYCEKHFRDRKTLKEHMRKKGHKRINPENRFYDKYFLINYYKSRHDHEESSGILNDSDKSSSMLRRSRMYHLYRHSYRTHRETKSPDSKGDMLDELVESDSDWSVWETDSNLPITCLFCLHAETSIDEIKSHMIQSHCFDLDTVISKLNFYQKIKFVNYTRRQMQIKQCINCDFKVEDSAAKESALEILLKHMSHSNHFRIDDPRRYNQPQYFFPTDEEDPFLYFLEDTYEDSDYDDSSNVICEDMKAQLNINAEIFIAENFLKDANF